MPGLATYSGQCLASVSCGIARAMASLPLARFKESIFNQLDSINYMGVFLLSFLLSAFYLLCILLKEEIACNFRLWIPPLKSSSHLAWNVTQWASALWRIIPIHDTIWRRLRYTSVFSL